MNATTEEGAEALSPLEALKNAARCLLIWRQDLLAGAQHWEGDQYHACDETFDQLEAAVGKVENEVERDAARYRWLRDSANQSFRTAPAICMVDCLQPGNGRLLVGEEADRAIDETRVREAGGQAAVSDGKSRVIPTDHPRRFAALQDVARALRAERTFDDSHPVVVHLHDTDDSRIVSRGEPEGPGWGPVVAIRELPAPGEAWDPEALAQAMLTDAYEDEGAHQLGEERQARDLENALVREQIEDAQPVPAPRGRSGLPIAPRP